MLHFSQQSGHTNLMSLLSRKYTQYLVQEQNITHKINFSLT